MTSVVYNMVSFFNHKKCKDKVNKLIQSSLEDCKKIQSLDSQILTLVNQIQEQKAMYDYQCFKLEKNISDLRSQLKSARKIKRRIRTKPKVNEVGNIIVKVTDSKKVKSNDRPA